MIGLCIPTPSSKGATAAHCVIEDNRRILKCVHSLEIGKFPQTTSTGTKVSYELKDLNVVRVTVEDFFLDFISLSFIVNLIAISPYCGESRVKA